MPLGDPTTLDSFLLAGVKLQAIAPEEMREGLFAAFRIFFFAKGDPIVQKGRVTPKPISLSFKFNGPDAIASAQFLKGIQLQQQPIGLSWAGQLSFTGYLTDFEFTYRQKEVTGTLTFTPTKDNSVGVTKAPASTAFQQSQKVQDALQSVEAAIAGITSSAVSIQSVLSDPLGSTYALINGIQSATDQVNSAITTYGDIASIPFQVIGQMGDAINGVIGLFPAAIGELNDKILAPATPLLQGTANFLGIGYAQNGLSAMDDALVGLLNLDDSIAPQPLPYVVQEGDTLALIAGYFATDVATLLQLNPGLSEATLAPGMSLQVPHG